MEFNITLESVSYEESRREFFLYKKRIAESKLEKAQKKLSMIPGLNAYHSLLYNQCCELGLEVSYYDDAIKALDVYEEVKE